MRTIGILLILVWICSACGCAGMSTTEQRALSGGAMGTAAGLGAAALFGGPLLVGAAVGAAAGAVGGVVVDEMQRR